LALSIPATVIRPEKIISKILGRCPRLAKLSLTVDVAKRPMGLTPEISKFPKAEVMHEKLSILRIHAQVDYKFVARVTELS
jgi:hypothetical protein